MIPLAPRARRILLAAGAAVAGWGVLGAGGLAALVAALHHTPLPTWWWPPTSWALLRVTPGFGQLAVMGLLAWPAWIAWRIAEAPAAPDAAFGTAAWRPLAADGRIARWPFAWTRRAPATAPGGVACATTSGTGWVVPFAAEDHVVVFGAPGTGKSRKVFLPTLGVCGTARTHLVVTDVKGELWAQTAAWLAAQGYRVLRLDFREPGRGVQWNPLAPIVEACWLGDLDRASRGAWELAHALTSGLPDQEALWRQSAEALIAALALAVADAAEPAAAHPASLYHTLVAHQQALDALFADFPADHPARQAWGQVAVSQAETRMGILTTTAAQLRLFADRSLAWVTAGHDPAWPMGGSAELWHQQPVAVFVVIPHDRGAVYPLVTLFLQQLAQTLTAEADRAGGTLPRPVYFLLDEFGNLPAWPQFAAFVAVARSQGLRFVMGLQSVRQLHARYGEHDAHTIAGSAGTWIVLSVADMQTAQLVAERIGTRAVWSRTRQEGPQPGAALAPHSVPLLRPEDLTRIGPTDVIVLQRDRQPGRWPLRDLAVWGFPFQPAAPPEPTPVTTPPLFPPPETAAAWATEPADPGAFDLVF